MAHADMEQRVHKALCDSVVAVRAYEGSELSKHAVEMLDALAAGYCLELVFVEPQGLVRVQSALRQVNALRAVFANEGVDVPKI